MESTVKVMSTPNIMRKAFADYEVCSIRSMEAMDFEDPAPDMPDDEWCKKYGDTKLVYKVRVRYPELFSPLWENYVYSSWESILKAIRKHKKPE